MKKVLFFASALAGLFFAASCQQETLEPEQMSKTVTFTVEAPGALATKGTINAGATIADGTNVNEVHFEVYKNVEGVDHALLDVNSEPMAKGVVEMANKKANITLDLLQDQEYTVIFWAQVKDAGHYDTSDLRCVELANSAKANDETRAAFFKRFDFDTYEHRDYPEILLRRPFAQLNLLTTMESLKPVSTGQTSGYEIDAQTSQVIVTGLAASFNTVTGIGNYVDYPYTFNMYDTPEEQGQATLEVNGKKYHYVSMNYMFVPVNAEDGSATVDIAYEIVTDKGSIQHEIANVPIRENYRTNVIGNLFTKESKFEIIVDANFDGQELVEVWDGREVSEPAQVDGKYVISTAAELAWLSAAVNGTLPPVAVNGVAQPTPAPQKFTGKTFMLLEDIDLANPAIELPDVTWIPIGANGRFEGTFDGNGKTIRNLVVKTEGETPAGLFGHVQTGKVMNVTVEDATVEGHASAAVIVAHGVCAKIDNCHVENAIVLSTPYNKDEANNVGAIAGFLGADGGSAWVKGCTVNNAHITAYRKVGGVVGAANQAAEVTGNTVANSTITADQTSEYKKYYAANLGKVVGYKHDNATVSDNTDTDNVELRHLVNSVEELANAAEGAYVNVANGEYNLTDNITVNKMPIQIHEGAVVINGHDYNITSGSTGSYAFITKGDNASLVLDASVTSLGGGVSAGNNGKVVFNGQGVDISKYTTSSPARYNFYARTGGEIVINSGTFKFNSTNNTRRAYVCVEEGGKVIINGGTFGKASTRSDYKKGIRVMDAQSSVIITGGTFGFDPSEWVAAGYHAIKDGQNWVVVSLSEGDNLKEAVAVAGATVNMAAGEYTFPQTIAEGVKIVCEPGTVFNGSSNLNLKTASVEGATFKNDNGSVVNSGSISGTYKNCVFEGQNAFRYGYAGETLVFEDCTFRETGSEWVFHFDGASTGVTNASIICRRCTFDGDRVAIAGGVSSLVMEDCNFINGSYFNSYCNSDYSGCNFNTSVRPLAAHHKYTDCTINGASVALSNLKFYNGYDCTLEIDGVEYTFEGGFVTNAEGAVVVWTRDLLQNALNSASADMTIALYNNITGDVTVSQKENVNLVIDGAAKNYDGTIYIHGNSRNDGAETLTIQNVAFLTDAAKDFISSDEAGSVERYAHNVTVKDCTFEGHAEAVGLRFRQAYDITVKDCVANGIHSLAQNTSTSGQIFDGCIVTAGRGINLLTSSVDTKVVDCQFTATKTDGYGIRVDAAAGSAMTVTDCTINAYEPVVLRSASAGYEFNLASSTLTAGNGYEIVVKGETPAMNGVEGLNVKIN